DVHQQSDNQLYNRLFFFGQKARHFWMDQERDVGRRSWLQSLHDQSDATFAWLFCNIARVLNYKERRVQIFCQQNLPFTTYFKGSKNEQNFVARARRLNRLDCQVVRDYYLHFLHTFGRRGIHKPTLLVSASSDLTVARNF